MESYRRVGDCCWVHPLTGDVVQWDRREYLFKLFRPATGELLWWGPTRAGINTWHSYRPTRLRSEISVYAVIGAAIFVWAATINEPVAGLVGGTLLMGWGATWGWLWRRHRFVAASLGAVAALGLFRAL
jgi:uncharacterized membrane protein YeaQ/YmgE (transglycosylase-associated protein family)